MHVLHVSGSQLHLGVYLILTPDRISHIYGFSKNHVRCDLDELSRSNILLPCKILKLCSVITLLAFNVINVLVNLNNQKDSDKHAISILIDSHSVPLKLRSPVTFENRSQNCG